MKLSSVSPCCPGNGHADGEALASRSRGADAYSAVVHVARAFCKRNASSDVALNLEPSQSTRQLALAAQLPFCGFAHLLNLRTSSLLQENFQGAAAGFVQNTQVLVE